MRPPQRDPLGAETLTVTVFDIAMTAPSFWLFSWENWCLTIWQTCVTLDKRIMVSQS